MLQVHEITDNVEGFDQRHDNEDTCSESACGNGEGNEELERRYNQQDPEYTPDTFGIRLFDFARGCRLMRISVSHEFDSLNDEGLNQIEEGEHKHPHQIYKVPVETYFFHHFIAAAFFVNAHGRIEEDEEVEQHAR